VILDFLYHGAIYTSLGVLAGLMAGILGVGGGIIVIPGLVLVFQFFELIPEQFIMHVAAGTSLAIMIFNSLASLRAHFRIGEILWPVFNYLWPGVVAGVIVGAVIADFIPNHWLKILFGLFLLFIVLKMLTDIHVIEHIERVPRAWLNRLISFLIGLKSGLLGVGGGILIIPYLTYRGVAIRKIAAVSNLCTLSVALTGTIMFIIIGLDEMRVPYSTGYVYWPAVLWAAIPSIFVAPLGAKLNYILPIMHLKYVFIVVLLLTAIKMLF
jgi:uncharacterized membrane protein YfcA